MIENRWPRIGYERCGTCDGMIRIDHRILHMDTHLRYIESEGQEVMSAKWAAIKEDRRRQKGLPSNVRPDFALAG